MFCCSTQSNKLRLLRGREQAWRRLDLPEVTSIPVRHSPSGIYDLTRGVFLLGERSRQSSRRSTDGLKFIKISSIGANGTERGDGHISWSTIKLERPIIDIGLSAQEHDLIAVVTYEFKNGSPVASIDIHLLNLSTGSYHPSASRPIIHVEDIHL
ncbi:hypothetical protein A0H81_02072 [Grifola frondosa]|uniref:Uncharacterized protein n=1 Tax=Grifola frondosa TaxID=5627 RepID=A0A1C7MNI0_GRIFR|nr:hypothetical protein A0H81_02072 [Grifola frondosa]